MKSNYKPLGKYIQPVVGRNNDLGDLPLMGLSIQKKFIPSIANTIGTDMSTYRTIYKNQFAFGPVTSRNGDKITIALFNDYDKALISQAYIPFEVKDNNELDAEYLMMWFRRPEFDRYARFKSHGSAREIFDWEEMCNTLLPVPKIDKQREIVKEYNAIQNRIALNQQLIQKLEETAQAIYKQWFVEFEFPDETGKPYKSNGGEMVWNEELGKEIPKGWEVKNLEDTVNIIRGASPRPIEEYMSNDNSGMPWVKISDATACATKYLFETKQFISKEGVPKSRKVKIGTLILSNSASPGLPKFMMIDACVHDGWLIFNDYKGISKELLYNFLLVNRQQIVSSSNGSVFNNLKTEILKQYKIVVPVENILKKGTKIFQILDSQFSIAAKKDYCYSELSKVLYAKMSKGNY